MRPWTRVAILLLCSATSLTAQTADAALTHAFKRLALSQAASPESEEQLLVDTAHPRNLLQLHFDEPRKPQLRFRSYDYHYSLY